MCGMRGGTFQTQVPCRIGLHDRMASQNGSRKSHVCTTHTWAWSCARLSCTPLHAQPQSVHNKPSGKHTTRSCCPFHSPKHPSKSTTAATFNRNQHSIKIHMFLTWNLGSACAFLYSSSSCFTHGARAGGTYCPPYLEAVQQGSTSQQYR